MSNAGPEQQPLSTQPDDATVNLSALRKRTYLSTDKGTVEPETFLLLKDFNAKSNYMSESFYESNKEVLGMSYEPEYPDEAETEILCPSQGYSLKIKIMGRIAPKLDLSSNLQDANGIDGRRKEGGTL